MRAVSLEVLEDRTPQSRCDEGFLRVRRLTVRHHYDDGTASPAYSCDVVSRPGVDAVTVVLWFRGAGGRPQVVLKEGVRPAVYLRREQQLIHPDPEAPLLLVELVAGVLEPGDEGAGGARRRAAAECREEVGVELQPERFERLGGSSFPTPGAGDERVEFFAAEIDEAPEDGALAGGDGSPMEHGTRVVVLPLEEAIARCSDGRIPDMKTEIGLRRLADRLR